MVDPRHRVCYRGAVRRPVRWRALLPLLLLCACRSGAMRSPERACAALLLAVQRDDAEAVFAALLQNTQWSLHSVARQQREMQALIERDYPRAERTQALSRLLRRDLKDGRDLFVRLYPERYAAGFRRRLDGAQGPAHIKTEGSSAACTQQGAPPAAPPFRLALSPAGRWGLSELDAEWELLKVRGVHDLATVQENARLYTQERP